MAEEKRFMDSLKSKDNVESSLHSAEHIIESQTMEWIRSKIIGLNLCPFAERPIKTNNLSIHIVRGDDHEEISNEVLEVMLMQQDEPGTSIVIAPDYYPHDFERYLSMIQFLETRVMVAYELHDDIQIAPFHPEFMYDNMDDDSTHTTSLPPIEVATNRSPYPMFHILKVDDVAKAVGKLGGDPGKVWRRNAKLLNNLEKRLGRPGAFSFLRHLHNGLVGEEGHAIDVATSNHENLVTEVLKQTKIEFDQDEARGGEKQTVRGGWTR